MNGLYSQVPNDEELLQFILDGEALPEEARRRFEQYKTCQGSLATLLLALKVKDPQLYKHSLRVQQLTHYLTQVFRLPKDEAATIELAALFHDLGKIVIPDRILHKASCLTRQEFESIKKHPAHGALILSQMKPLNKVALLVYHHHERWDGSGYPSGLRGETIPFGARLVAIVDAFEAMTSSRAYQTRRTPVQALEELRRCAERQFDPVLVNRFSTSLEVEVTTPLHNSSDFLVGSAVDLSP